MSFVKWDSDGEGQDSSVPSLSYLADHDMLTTASWNCHTPEFLRHIKTSADMTRTLETMKLEKAKTQDDGATTHETDHTFPLF